MRKIGTLIIGLAIAGTTYAQQNILPVDESTGKVTYMEVVEAPGMNPTETFQELKKWAANHGCTLSSADGTKGEFSCKMKVNYPNPKKTGTDEGTISYTGHLMAKDGRYRFIFTDFMHSSKSCNGGDIKPLKVPCGSSKISIAGWARVRKETNTKMVKLVNDLKKTIKESANDPSKNDDW